jgi:hypothetical protein
VALGPQARKWSWLLRLALNLGFKLAFVLGFFGVVLFIFGDTLERILAVLLFASGCALLIFIAFVQDDVLPPRH